MASDKVLVMDAGQVRLMIWLRSWYLTMLQVAEFDSPDNLLKNKDSMFYSLVEEAGLVSEDHEWSVI